MANNNTKKIIKSLESLYVKGNFEDARGLLIKNKPYFDKGLFHYNLGTIDVKMKSYAAGRYNLEKAIKEGHINTKVIHNLNVAKNNIQNISVETHSYISDQFLTTAYSLPSGVFLTISLFLALVILLLKQLKVIKPIKILIPALVLAFIPYFFSTLYLNNFSVAINLKPSIIREGPSEMFDKIHDLDAGIKVMVGPPRDGWYFIESPKHLVGWVKANKIGIL